MNIKSRLLLIACLAFSSSGQAMYSEEETPFERERSYFQKNGRSGLMDKQRSEFDNDQLANTRNAKIGQQLRSEEKLQARYHLRSNVPWYYNVYSAVSRVINSF